MSAPPGPPLASVPMTKIELSFSCRNLTNLDYASKSDPMIIIYMRKQANAPWKEFDRTEMVVDNLNPDFVKKLELDFYFEEIQYMKFEVFDVDDIKENDYIGCVETTLAEIAYGSVTKPLYTKTESSASNKKSHGDLIITAEEINVGDNNKTFIMQIAAEKIDKIGGFFSSDPNVFIQFLRSSESNNPIIAHKTPTRQTRNPRFDGVELSLRKFTNGDLDRSVEITFVHQYSNGDLKILHRFQFTPRELESNPMINKKDGKMSMTIQTRSIIKPSFVQYLHAGMQLNFHVAVDFTGSNGDPRSPSSLHYINPNGQLNSYECGINFIGTVLQQYDSDKMFPAYGFGAKILSTGQISHDFALTFNPESPEVFGVEGIMTAYKRSIQSVQLWGPTNFSPIINRVAGTVKSLEKQGHRFVYTVLMILTDGAISDMQATIDAIVGASDSGLSIVIVGVGNADFSLMEQLDGDDGKLKDSRGNRTKRDIVQFVRMNDYFNVQQQNVNNFSYDSFNKAVLGEIPDQVVGYFMSRNITP